MKLDDSKVLLNHDSMFYTAATLTTIFLNFFPVFIDLISKQKQLNVNLPNINIANTAGAICTPKLVKDIQKHLNVTNVCSIYGLTGIFSMSIAENKKI